MYGPGILVRTLSVPTRRDSSGRTWQYHSRSDHHSKVACWGLLFDLLLACPLLRKHAADRKIAFGINHEMRDFVQDRRKNLDLVLFSTGGEEPEFFQDLAGQYQIQLDANEQTLLSGLPPLRRGRSGGVLLALEAKACMTAHQRALPRLYDELNSSHQTVHGSTAEAIAAGFAMVNIAASFISPDLNKGQSDGPPSRSVHKQPRDAEMTVNKLRQLRKRANVGDSGYDALAIIVVDCANDGSPVSLVENSPAPATHDIHNYRYTIERLSAMYATRFKDL